jgi:hypothetical protein
MFVIIDIVVLLHSKIVEIWTETFWRRSRTDLSNLRPWKLCWSLHCVQPHWLPRDFHFNQIEAIDTQAFFNLFALETLCVKK